MIPPGDHDGKDSLFLNIKKELERRGEFQVDICTTLADVSAMLVMNVRIQAILYDWEQLSTKVPQLVSKINDQLPVFAFSLSHTAKDLDINDLLFNLHFVDYAGYSEKFVADHIERSINEYLEKILPPFTKALMQYTHRNKYPYCTPGHLGGSAFLKSPAGAIFYDFYGPNLFASDISISMTELGSLLDHSGPHQMAEEYIAKTFDADRSLIVTNGTSTANKIVGMSICHQGETVLVDRNTHKSIAHLLMMTDVAPLYLKPTRNAYGIIGGIPKEEFSSEMIQKKIEESNAFAKKNGNHTQYKWPSYVVITNSTYDGILYNTDYIKKTLDVKNIHFDAAWIAHAPFDPIYKGLYGMSSDAPKEKTIFETQSVHKLLAAFSQASIIHIKGKFDEALISEAFMLHTSTSPFYPMVASTEMSAAMMRGTSGMFLMRSSLSLAMDFRYEIKKLHKQNSNGWFFDVWQPNELDHTPKCWPLKPSDSWHGFPEVDSDHLFLDPIKITILTPGIEDGELADFGIPASILAKYLEDHGIIVEKTGPYSLLFLFSVGIDNAQSLKLLSELMEFKKEFDANFSVQKMLPGLYKENPVLYKKMRVQELARKIHDIHKQCQLTSLLTKAFDVLPKQMMTPYQAYQELVRGNIEICRLKDVKNRTCVEMLLPYPPGIPLIFPGEMIDDTSYDILEFLLTLCEIGNKFTGFSTNIHGAWQEDDGEYYVKVIKK